MRTTASLPPRGLPGLDPRFSRLLQVPSSDGSGQAHTWHHLDNLEALEAQGVEPVGTILCVHGNPTWSYLWRSLLSRAADDAAAGRPAWRVIAVDQLEMGFSERTGTARTLATRVADLGDFTRALGLAGSVITLGHDWGGVVSLGWAVDHPDDLAGIALLNTAIHQDPTERIPAPLRLALRRQVLERATVQTPAFLEITLSLAHPPLDPATKDAYRAPYLGAHRRGGIGGFVADIPVDASHESHTELERIAAALRTTSVPTLMLWGPRDPIFGDRYLDDLLERMPHADVHRFEGAGHLIAEDVDYAAAVLGWLAAAPGAPTGPPADPDIFADYQPLWHYLEEFHNSPLPAIVEMAPPGSSEPRTVSWSLLARRVDEIAAGLRVIGVRHGDRVSLLVPPGADLTALLYACVRIGAVVVVADAGLGLRGLTRAVRGARPDVIIGQPKGLAAAAALGWPGRRISTARLPESARRTLGVVHAIADLVDLGAAELAAGSALPVPPRPGDTAAVLFTSGSTGPAKGVVYTHAQLSAIRFALAGQYGVGPGTGLVAGFAPFALLGPALGTRSATPDMDVTQPATLTATAVADAVAAVDGTVVFLSPAAIANVVATSSALSVSDRAALFGVRTFLSAGAPVSERLLSAASELMPGATAHTPYGMTEGLLMTDITLDGIRAAAMDAAASSDARGGVCVGLPTATTTVRISALDADGVASGEPLATAHVTGEIVVSAPHVKDHYDRLWITDSASRAGTGAGRWHRTGDVGHLDAAGRLWVEGRLPHIISSPHGIITPVGPEQRIESVDSVARAAVVGVGPAGIQQVVAIVETVPPAKRVSVADPALAARLRSAAAMPIAGVLVVPRLPTDIRHNSKIDRTALAAWATGVLAGGRMTRP
ncbi:MAG: alpha/beta fold hydrolase [Burkholderiaceae bacterium]|nr:alpha/beta fold hydrolase [Microbacteriaceae bacterium]